MTEQKQTAEPIVTRLRKQAEYCEAYGEWNVPPRTLTEAADLITELVDVANNAFDVLGGVDDAVEIRADLLAVIQKTRGR